MGQGPLSQPDPAAGRLLSTAVRNYLRHETFR
jgi:hypothetical protein